MGLLFRLEPGHIRGRCQDNVIEQYDKGSNEYFWATCELKARLRNSWGLHPPLAQVAVYMKCSSLDLGCISGPSKCL